MKYLKPNRFSNSSLKTAVKVFMNFLIVACLFFAGCKKEDRHLKEITVHPGQSIQAAIDAACKGTVIKIEPGVYKESLKINKPGISLTGLGGEKKAALLFRIPGKKKTV